MGTFHPGECPAFGRVMDDLKKLSVERLRELARKHLGTGHSRLRTKAQLLAALKDVVRGPLSRLLDVAESVVPAATRVHVVEFPPGRRGRVRSSAARATAAKAPAATPPPPAGPVGRRSDAPPPTPPATAVAAPSPGVTRGSASRTAPAPAHNGPTGRARGRRVRPAARSVDRAGPPVTRAAVAPLERPAELHEAPVEEAFFHVPAAPRRPSRAPVLGAPVESETVAAPREVGTEAPLLLVRDPTTLFAFWDFRRELERGAALGLREPRLLLRLYRGEDLDRSLELPLSSRSVYVTGLRSGAEYTAEVLLLGRDGWTRPVGSLSAGRRLPPGRVSSRLEVRTLRLPWSEALSPAPVASAPSTPRHEPLDSPRRVPLPTSPGARGGPGDPAPSG
ncbi:MAG: DUF4912 domain-containing protein, partial [Myxococcaceae bacterium]